MALLTRPPAVARSTGQCDRQRKLISTPIAHSGAGGWEKFSALLESTRRWQPHGW